MGKFNEIDLKNWKDSEVWTDSLWIIHEREKGGKHQGFYHGNFIPQIPRQLFQRYTKKNDVILDPFVGSGTSAYVAEELKRNFIGIDIQHDLVKDVNDRVGQSKNFIELIAADSTKESTFQQIESLLKKRRKKSVQFAILHPPYADIIKFSNKKEDLSNSTTLQEFLDNFSKVVKNTLSILDKERYLAVVIGDKYTRGQWIPLGFYCMNEIQKTGATLKSVIVKNMEGNRGKQQKEAIWRYRALASDYYIFKHEYIFIFKK